MRSLKIIISILAALLAVAAPAAQAAENEPAPRQSGRPEIVDLGDQKFRIGQIFVDKAAGRFEVAAKILNIEKPLEFLAVKTDGYKGYESLLEVQGDAFEFNLACILIGLDASKATAPEYHFDKAPVVGDPVSVTVSWKAGDQSVSYAADRLIRRGYKAIEPAEWVYTGSGFLDDGTYRAHKDGTLIGFVHDPSSIIEHRTGVGLEGYGAIIGNMDLLPPEGSEVVLAVQRVMPAEAP